MNAFSHILFLVEFDIAEMACVSSNVRRTFHVPSGVRVQRSISERDVSHPRLEWALFFICDSQEDIREFLAYGIKERL